MKLLNPRYYGMIARCNACGALIGYEPNDVNESQNIKCPQCNFMLWVPFNPTYDGVIEERKEEDGESEESHEQ